MPSILVQAVLRRIGRLSDAGHRVAYPCHADGAQMTQIANSANSKPSFNHWQARAAAKVRQKLNSYFNDIRVRSFILNGAPFCYHSEQNREL
jgi:hypothetical protein